LIDSFVVALWCGT